MHYKSKLRNYVITIFENNEKFCFENRIINFINIFIFILLQESPYVTLVVTFREISRLKFLTMIWLGWKTLMTSTVIIQKYQLTLTEYQFGEFVIRKLDIISYLQKGA